MILAKMYPGYCDGGEKGPRLGTCETISDTEESVVLCKGWSD